MLKSLVLSLIVMVLVLSSKRITSQNYMVIVFVGLVLSLIDYFLAQNKAIPFLDFLSFNHDWMFGKISVVTTFIFLLTGLCGLIRAAILTNKQKL